jgi:hypothetical protein
MVVVVAEELERKKKRVGTALKLLFCESSDVSRACAFGIVHIL